jgi:parallel beta-helix repeat protein
MRERGVKSSAFAIGVLMVASALAGIGILEFATGAATAVAESCNLVVNSENVANNSIQTALNSASPGWTVCVGAGTYPEQLTIATNGVELLGMGPASTIIQPPSVSATTFDWDSAPNPLAAAAIILVKNVTGVEVQGLAVDGSAAQSSFSSCSTDYIGIDYQNSTGNILGDAVRNIQFSASLLGCQGQLAVYAYTGYFATGFIPLSPMVVTISHTVVTAYGKNGITCDDPGLTCDVNLDTTTGIGPTSAIAQNGIQIGYYAIGVVSANKVSANNYTGGGSTLNWYGVGYQASGILLYLTGPGTVVQKNTVFNNPMGIVDYSNNSSKILGNTVTNSTGYGIVANGAPAGQVLIANNTVKNPGTGGIGILVDSGTFNLTGNHIAFTSSGGSNGASQPVCGTGAYLSCTPTRSVSTAAIQAVSESGSGPTDVTLFKNAFRSDSLSLATLAVLGGSVSIVFA